MGTKINKSSPEIFQILYKLMDPRSKPKNSELNKQENTHTTHTHSHTHPRANHSKMTKINEKEKILKAEK